MMTEAENCGETQYRVKEEDEKSDKAERRETVHDRPWGKKTERER